MSLYDLHRNAVKERYKNAHSEVIHCLTPLHNFALKYFASMSRDGEIKVWRTLDLIPVLAIPQQYPEYFFITESLCEIQFDSSKRETTP